MNKIKMVVEKLVLLAAMLLSLTSLADHVSPAWDERVMMPVFHLPGWLLCGSVFAGFVVVSALMFVAMRRKGRTSMEFVVLEILIAAVLTCLLVLCKGFFYEVRVIHHPEDDSDRRARYTCPSCGGPRSTWHGLCMKCEERSRSMAFAEKKFESAKHALLELGVSRSQIDKAHDFWEKAFFVEWGCESDKQIRFSCPYDGACADIDDERRYRLPYDIWVELNQAKTFVEGLARHGYNSKWCKDILDQIRRRLIEPEERRKRDEDQRNRDAQERIKQMCLECQRRLHFGKGQTCPLCLGTGLTKQKTLCHGCKGMGKEQFDIDIKGTLSDCGLNQ